MAGGGRLEELGRQQRVSTRGVKLQGIEKVSICGVELQGIEMLSPNCGAQIGRVRGGAAKL